MTTPPTYEQCEDMLLSALNLVFELGLVLNKCPLDLARAHEMATKNAKEWAEHPITSDETVMRLANTVEGLRLAKEVMRYAQNVTQQMEAINGDH